MDRRDFLSRLGVLAGTGALAMNFKGVPLKAFSKPMFSINSFNGKILVIIQLGGGNDGLNTLIPFEDNLYYNKRPTLAIKKSDSIILNNLTGFHPSLTKFKGIFDDGKMSIIQNVGYDNPNYSHFRSTDIWLSASDSNQTLTDGWLGRYLEKAYPDYPSQSPNHPMAVQIGSLNSLLLDSKHGAMGVSIEDPNTFSQLVQGSSVDNDPPPSTIAGDELRFLKEIVANSIKYADVIKSAADKNQNKVEYPDTELGFQLSIIADLIGGGLQTPVYLATLDGFDTHASQIDEHAMLLHELSDAVDAFQKEIEAIGQADNVLTLTISEFGRRVDENGSRGTDHGTAAPLFVIGNTVTGGIIGDNPNLSNLDFNEDMFHSYDFRQVYSTVLNKHFGINDTTVEEILLRKFDYLPFLDGAVTNVSNFDSIPRKFELMQNHPNPFNPSTTISYSLPKREKVRLEVYNSIGQFVKLLVDEVQSAGKYDVRFNANNLPSGIYIYRLQTTKKTISKKMVLVK